MNKLILLADDKLLLTSQVHHKIQSALTHLSILQSRQSKIHKNNDGVQ